MKTWTLRRRGNLVSDPFTETVLRIFGPNRAARTEWELLHAVPSTDMPLVVWGVLLRMLPVPAVVHALLRDGFQFSTHYKYTKAPNRLRQIVKSALARHEWVTRGQIRHLKTVLVEKIHAAQDDSSQNTYPANCICAEDLICLLDACDVVLEQNAEALKAL